MPLNNKIWGLPNAPADKITSPHVLELLGRWRYASCILFELPSLLMNLMPQALVSFSLPALFEI